MSPTTTRTWFCSEKKDQSSLPTTRHTRSPTHRLERLDKLLAELEDGQALPLILNAQARNLAKRRRLVKRLLLPRRDVLGLLARRDPPRIRRERPLVALRHRVQPRSIEVPRLGIRLLGRLLRLELPPLLGERRTGERSAVQSSVGRLDDLDGGEFESALRLAGEEGGFGVVDLDIELLVCLGSCVVAPETVPVRVGEEVLVESGVVGGGGGAGSDHLLDLPSLGRGHPSRRARLVVVCKRLAKRDAVAPARCALRHLPTLLLHLLL